uniref:Uncharacterized protein n=1 Tax=Anas platyrhynchos TaxID=8839 RepID=A0A8B9T848_ANAPL
MASRFWISPEKKTPQYNKTGQPAVTLTVKKCPFIFSWNFLCFSLCPLSLIPVPYCRRPTDLSGMISEAALAVTKFLLSFHVHLYISCIYTHMYVLYICISTHTYIYVYIYISKYVHVSLHTYMHTSLNIQCHVLDVV